MPAVAHPAIDGSVFIRSDCAASGVKARKPAYADRRHDRRYNVVWCRSTDGQPVAERREEPERGGNVLLGPLPGMYPAHWISRPASSRVVSAAGGQKPPERLIAVTQSAAMPDQATSAQGWLSAFAGRPGLPRSITNDSAPMRCRWWRPVTVQCQPSHNHSSPAEKASCSTSSGVLANEKSLALPIPARMSTNSPASCSNQ